MRLDIRYKMHFRYGQAVQESHNEIRMKPCENRFQKVIYYRLRSNPPVRLLQAVDYWGTAVDHLGIRSSHTELELLAESAVETSPRPAPKNTIRVEDLSDPDFYSDYYEFLIPSIHVQWSPDDVFVKRASEVAQDSNSLLEMVVAVINEARNALVYVPGSTEIGISLTELFAGGSGVCQDFAHLAIGMLRSVGVPACYVSGYLFAADETQPIGSLLTDISAISSTDDSGSIAEAGELGYTTFGGFGGELDEVHVQTHAWIMAALPGYGWWALDPTNGSLVGERHVIVGYGRDYGDVPPVRGVYKGPTWSDSDVDSVVIIGRQDTSTEGWDHSVQNEPPHIVVQSGYHPI